MLGLEYGKRSVSVRASEEGLVVPIACLNRVWCCGFYVGEGQKNRVSLSASEKKVFGGRFPVTGIGARFGVQNAEPLRAGRNIGAMCAVEGSLSVSVSEEIPLDLGP